MLSAQENNFKHLIRQLATPVLARLKSYANDELNGQLNAAVLNDFKTDNEFARISNQLHEEAMKTLLDEFPVMDGDALIGSVEIRTGQILYIQFELCFLSPRYFLTPACFSIEIDGGEMDSGIAQYGCGTLNHHGQLCTANTNNCVFPADDGEWATIQSSRFGESDLINWLTNKKKRR